MNATKPQIGVDVLTFHVLLYHIQSLKVDLIAIAESKQKSEMRHKKKMIS